MSSLRAILRFFLCFLTLSTLGVAFDDAEKLKQACIDDIEKILVQNSDDLKGSLKYAVRRAEDTIKSASSTSITKETKANGSQSKTGIGGRAFRTKEEKAEFLSNHRDRLSLIKSVLKDIDKIDVLMIPAFPEHRVRKDTSKLLDGSVQVGVLPFELTVVQVVSEEALLFKFQKGNEVINCLENWKTDGLVDGTAILPRYESGLRAVIWRSGTYEYISEAGGKRTIAKYMVVPPDWIEEIETKKSVIITGKNGFSDYYLGMDSNADGYKMAKYLSRNLKVPPK